MEILSQQLTGKLIWIGLLMLGGIAFVISRMLTLGLNRVSAHATIRTIRKNPSKAKDLGASLDIPYSRKERFSNDHFEKLKAYIQSVSKLNDYAILYCDSIDAVHFIVLTELSFVDFDVDITGGASDTRKKAYHNFLLKFDREENALIVFSDIYADITHKFQKEEFMRAIFTGS